MVTPVLIGPYQESPWVEILRHLTTEDAGEYKFVPPTPGHLNQQTASGGSVRGLKGLGMLPQSSGIYQLKASREAGNVMVCELVFQGHLD